jgi:hypothetical protein
LIPLLSTSRVWTTCPRQTRRGSRRC